MDRDLWLLTVYGRRLLVADPENLKAVTAEQIELAAKAADGLARLLELQGERLDRQAEREREIREQQARMRRDEKLQGRLADLMPILIERIITGSGK
jgi:hypothetical protein